MIGKANEKREKTITCTGCPKRSECVEPCLDIAMVMLRVGITYKSVKSIPLASLSDSQRRIIEHDWYSGTLPRNRE